MEEVMGSNPRGGRNFSHGKLSKRNIFLIDQIENSENLKIYIFILEINKHNSNVQYYSYQIVEYNHRISKQLYAKKFLLFIN